MSEIVVRPVRFTDHIEAMQQFLETLGLRPRMASVRGGWVDLDSRGGMVALHSAESSTTGGLPGQTGLSFECDDVRALADRLRSAGVPDVTVYDEAYGQVLTCRDPLGDEIHFDGRSDDLYGYRDLRSADAPRHDLTVVPVRFTDPLVPYGRWLEALGLTRVGDPGGSYVTYAAGEGRHGCVGVHHVFSDDPADLPLVAGEASAHLTFATTEVLEELAARLRAAGHADARVITADVGAMLTVTDPDGQDVQVHEAPSS